MIPVPVTDKITFEKDIIYLNTYETTNYINTSTVPINVAIYCSCNPS